MVTTSKRRVTLRDEYKLLVPTLTRSERGGGQERDSYRVRRTTTYLNSLTLDIFTLENLNIN